MATYSSSEKDRILRIPIPSIMKHFGKRTDHNGQMYFSPFRDECEPSFHVDPRKNLWMDFGSGEGGNVLTLTRKLSGMNSAAAWDFLASLDPSIVNIDTSYQRTASKGPSQIIIDQVSQIVSPLFIDYAASRGIPQGILLHYCYQVRYHIGGHDFPSSAIGFPTCDGWILRHAGGNIKIQKRCTSSQCTLLGTSGVITKIPTSDRVEIFEGFFDFLSWLVIKDRTKPFCDICVLNSVNNLSRAEDFIKAHQKVSCWLDNDNAGRKTFEQILSFSPHALNQMAQHPESKDVNDYLTSSFLKAIVQHNSSTSHSLTPKF